MTALENVAVPLELAGHRDAFAARRAGARDRSASPIACTIIRRSCPAASSSASRSPARSHRDPSILLADEPTGNLDEATGAQIIELLFAKHAERGMTLVLVTHDAGLARRCDRVVRLRSGRIDDIGADPGDEVGRINIAAQR